MSESGTVVPADVRCEIDGVSYPFEKFMAAYRAFMLEDTDLTQCAKDTGLPLLVVLEWSQKNKWAERKAKLLTEAVRSLESQERLTKALERREVITRHLAEARKVAARAVKFAEEAGAARDLKAAAEAYKSAADVEARASGMAEKTIEKGGEGGSDARTPNFFMGITATKVEVKDITSEVGVGEARPDSR
jgi:hypothetical protein